MTEATGEHVRRVLRLLDWSERRVVMVAIFNKVMHEPPTDPLDRVLEAVYHDAYAAEDEERALRDLVDEP